MSELKWKAVPLKHSGAWQEAYKLSPPSEGLHLSSSCPVCGATSLFRYYALGKEQPRELQGVKFKGLGSYWEWCSSCHSFEHMSVFVPEWWDIAPLDVDHAKLTATPGLLDDAIAKR